MNKILVCTDGSAYSFVCYDYAAWMAQRTGAALEVLYVSDLRQFEVPMVADLSGSLGVQPYQAVLGKLQEYDEQNTSDLVKSLACFLEANGHWGDAAEKLFVHRHTLRYRMKRVEEITGRDLDQSQDRMEFWLALKAKELIDQSTKGRTAQ